MPEKWPNDRFSGTVKKEVVGTDVLRKARVAHFFYDLLRSIRPGGMFYECSGPIGPDVKQDLPRRGVVVIKQKWCLESRVVPFLQPPLPDASPMPVRKYALLMKREGTNATNPPWSQYDGAHPCTLQHE